jgi:hypothetical protein
MVEAEGKDIASLLAIFGPCQPDKFIDVVSEDEIMCGG